MKWSLIQNILRNKSKDYSEKNEPNLIRQKLLKKYYKDDNKIKISSPYSNLSEFEPE